MTPAGAMYHRCALRVLRSHFGQVAPLKCWGRRGGGMFFLTADRVLLVRGKIGSRWSAVEVPEDGVAEED